MVKVVGPLFSAEARGRLGDVVYGTWRGVSFVRTLADPPGPPSDAQSYQRSIFKAQTLLWRDLSAAQRTLWNAWAIEHTTGDWTGQIIRMSGFNAFLKINGALASIGCPVRNTPPPDVPQPLIYSISIEPAGPFSGVYWQYNPNDDYTHWQVQMRYQTLENVARQPDFKHAVTFQHTDFEGQVMYLSNVPFTNGGHFGIWLRLVHESYGQAGAWSLITATTTAFVP